MPLRTNDPAPQFSLFDVEGQPVSLESLQTQGNHILLVFLRHLG
jgi:peroxiredoxin